MQETFDLSRKIVALRIVLRRVCMCEKCGKTTLAQRTKLLFLLSQKEYVSSSDLVSSLCINKSNLTILSSQLESEGLISTCKKKGDKRIVYNIITPTGKIYLDERLKIIESSLSTCFESKEEANEFCEKLDDIMSKLEYVNIE